MAHTRNIALFGDSLSKGIVVNNNKIERLENNAVALVEKKLNIKINNFSVFGQTLKRLCSKKMVDDYLLKMSSPKDNCIVISIGGNDSNFDWKKVSITPNEKHFSVTKVEDFATMLDELVKKILSLNIKVVLVTQPPISSELFFNNVISKKTNGKRVLEFLKNDLSSIYRYQERFSLEIIKCAIKNNCDFIDLRSDFLELSNYNEYLCADGIHLNEKGHQFASDIIAKHF